MSTATLEQIEQEAAEEMEALAEKHGLEIANAPIVPAFPADDFAPAGGLVMGPIEPASPETAAEFKAIFEGVPEPEAVRDLRDWAKRVKSVEERLREAQKETESIKKDLKEAKDTEDEIVLELSVVIRQDPSATPGPLFDKVEREGLTAIDATDESWREIHLHDALPDLSSAVQKKLADASITTMGQLADWTKTEFSPGHFQALSDIKGIGKGTAEKIEDACSAFWARRAATPTQEPAATESSADAPEQAAAEAILDALDGTFAQAEQSSQPETNGNAKKGRKRAVKP